MKDIEMKSSHELQYLARHLGVDTQGCLEKSELVERILRSGRVEVVREAAECSDATDGSCRPHNYTAPRAVCTGACPAEAIVDTPQQPIRSCRPSSAQVKEMGIRDLKHELRRSGLDISGCLEKHELVQKLLTSRTPCPSSQAPTPHPSDSAMHSQSTNDLQRLARLRGLSLAGCVERADILQRLAENAQPSVHMQTGSSNPRCSSSACKNGTSTTCGVDSLDVLMSSSDSSRKR